MKTFKEGSFCGFALRKTGTTCVLFSATTYIDIHPRDKMGLENLKTEGKTTSNESRKTKKPLIEKQRRKRINDSLHELKRLVLEALHRDITLYEKMEKADVLDLTVNYLKSTHCAKKQQENTTGLAGYQAGYRECQDHMTRVLITDPSINANQKSQIISHIAGTRPVMSLNLPRPIHTIATSSTYPVQSQFITTPPPSPIPSPTARHPVSPMEGLTLLSQSAELKPNRRLSYTESPTRTESVWRPWQTRT